MYLNFYLLGLFIKKMVLFTGIICSFLCLMSLVEAVEAIIEFPFSVAMQALPLILFKMILVIGPKILFIAGGFAILYTYKELKYHNSNTIFFNAGVSPFKLWKCGFLFSVFLAVLIGLVSIYWSPHYGFQTLLKLRKLQDQSQALPLITDKNFMSIGKDFTFYANSIDESGKNSYENTLIHLKIADTPSSIFSQKAEITPPSLENNYLSVHLTQGTLLFLSKTSSWKMNFDDYQIQVKQGFEQGNIKKSNSYWTYSDYKEKMNSSPEKKDYFFVLLLLKILSGLSLPLFTFLAGWMNLTPEQSPRITRLLKQTHFINGIVFTTSLFIFLDTIPHIASSSTNQALSLYVLTLIGLYTWGSILFFKPSMKKIDA